MIEKSDLRLTLAGLPVVEAVFSHSSQQFENTSERAAQFDLAVIAIGDLAQILQQAQVGRDYRIQGFINRKSLKSIKLRLHLTHMSPI